MGFTYVFSFNNPKRQILLAPFSLAHQSFLISASRSFLVGGFKFRLENHLQSKSLRYKPGEIYFQFFLGRKYSLQWEEYSNNKGWNSLFGSKHLDFQMEQLKL